jgi:hypothetical protein
LGFQEGGDPGAVIGTGESGAVVLVPGVSMADPGMQHADYVPRIVPRGTRSSGKRVLWIALSLVYPLKRTFVHRAR